MKKVILAVLLVAIAGSVSACPKGTHPYGGTGSHHAGGSCH